MNAQSQTIEPGTAVTAALVADPFDVSGPFSRWLDDLESARNPLSHQSFPTEDEETSDIYIGSFPGSNCELSFEGVLHFDGYSFGPISSPEGTLVLSKRGRIEADVNVKVAIISGWVTGNITATERVILESEARVTGQIITGALSVKLGAVFDGECLFTQPEVSIEVTEPPRKRRASKFEMAVAAGNWLRPAV